MSEIHEQIQILKFRFKGLEHETDGFTWDYTSATDEQVFETTTVAQDTINGLSETIMKIIKPVQRQTLRKQIAYLIGLRHRQQEVWTKFIADCEARTNNANKWVQQNTR